MKCSPENCPILDWTNMSEDERKTRRQQEALRLYQQGFTAVAIAALFGVSHQTIGRDLEEFVHDGQTPPRTSKRGRKGEGRPKGKPKQPGVKKTQYAANVHPDDWKRFKRKAELEGKSAATKLGELLAEPEIDSTTFSPTQQQKNEVWRRQELRRMEAQFEQRVRDEARRRVDQIFLPDLKEKIDQAQDLYKHRRGAMDKATFNRIRRALHPDSRQSISDTMLADAFDAFMRLEKYLLDEKDSPTDFSGLPSSLAEWEKAKQASMAARRKQHKSNPTTGMSRRI